MSEKQLEKKTLIGPGKRKVAIIKRNQLESYVDSAMYRLYNIWKMWKMGFGLPLSGSWAEQPIWMIEIITMLEQENNNRET